MTDHDRSDHSIDQFMQALDEETPYEKAHIPSSRVLWLKAKWAEQREQDQRTARIRLFAESTAQTLVGIAALLTGYYYWPELQSELTGLLEMLPEPAAVYPPVLIVTTALTLVVSFLGTRIMLRA